MKVPVAKDSVKRMLIVNMLSDKGIQPTPCLMGSQGIGKTQIYGQIAKELNADFDCLQGSLLQDGDIAGLPLAVRNDSALDSVDPSDPNVHYNYDSYGEFQMLPHPIIRRIRDKENKVFKQAFYTERGKNILKSVGIDVDALKDDVYKSKEEHLKALLELLDNKSKNDLAFGYYNENGEKVNSPKEGSQFMRPTVLLIDELNRCQQTVQNELMNFLLSHDVNDYQLPFWVMLGATANPPGSKTGYAVREWDAAQLSRLSIFNVDVDVKSFIEYATQSEFDTIVVDYIADNDRKALISDETVADGQPSPCPRSWEMVSNNLKKAAFVNENHFTSMSPELIESETDQMCIALLGSNVGASFNSYRKDISNRIVPATVLTAKEDTVEDDKMAAINGLTSLRRSVVIDRLIEYYSGTISDMFLNKGLKFESEFAAVGDKPDATHKQAKNLCLQLLNIIEKLEHDEHKYMMTRKLSLTEIDISERGQAKKSCILSLLYRPAFNKDVDAKCSAIVGTIVTDTAQASELMR